MCQVERESAGAMLRTGFWTAPRRQYQSVEDKFLLAYFLTCPERSSIGLFPIHLGEAAGRTGGDKHQFLAVMERLTEQREIAVDGYWVLVRNWWDHNNRPGPGLRVTILRTLEEAPAALRGEWEAIATAAGIFPFDWKDDKPGTQGGTPGATPAPGGRGRVGGTGPRAKGATVGSVGGGTQGNNNDNGNSNANIKTKTTTTTTHAAGGSTGSHSGSEHAASAAADDVPFPDNEAEQYRPAFRRICAELNATPDEASDLALELCARVEAAREHPRFRIQQHEPWMRRVVQEARAAGAPILRAGLTYAKKAEEAARSAAAANAAAIAAREEQDRVESAREQTVETLQALSEDELSELAASACAQLHRTATPARRDELRAAIVERRIPSGMGLAVLSRALRRLAEAHPKEGRL